MVAIMGERAGRNTTDHRPGRHVPHFASIPNEAISFLTPYSGLLLTLWIVILFSLKRFLLEIYVFPRCYRRTWRSMDDSSRRGFLVHHVSAGTKVVLLIVGAKPFSDVVFGKSALHDGYTKYHDRPTMGDVLLVLTQLFVALYIFELLIRKSPSPIAVAHHVGAIVIAQAAVALSLRLDKEVNATMEFVLCLVWAAFDVLAELWLNIAFILYRLYPDNHGLLAYTFGSTCIVSVMGTIAETVMVMTLFGQSWDRWDLSFKVVTPILHVLFMVAQLHAAKILYVMWVKQKALLAEEDLALLDPEGHKDKMKEETPKNEGVLVQEEVLVPATRPATETTETTAPRENSIDSKGSSSRSKRSGILGTVNKFFTGR